jgi:hypothetical protein
MLRIVKFCVQNETKLQNAALKRFIATTSVQCKTVQNTEKTPAAQTENHSFVMHLFRGQLESRQVFPYPDVLTDEQRDTLKMLVDPVSKFFEVRFFFKSDKICFCLIIYQLFMRNTMFVL